MAGLHTFTYTVSGGCGHPYPNSVSRQANSLAHTDGHSLAYTHLYTYSYSQTHSHTRVNDVQKLDSGPTGL